MLHAFDDGTTRASGVFDDVDDKYVAATAKTGDCRNVSFVAEWSASQPIHRTNESAAFSYPCCAASTKSVTARVRLLLPMGSSDADVASNMS